MLCRNKEKGRKAQNEIIEKTNSKKVHLYLADLSKQADIRNFVEDFRQKFDKLHILINNAGIVLKNREETIEGYEYTFAVNYLAPFLLTNLLLDLLQNATPSRIINVSADLYKISHLDFDDLQSKQNYNRFKVYARSKIALNMFTFDLARRLEGKNVTVNALHPGVVRTNLGHSKGINFGKILLAPIKKSAKKGAETTIYLATSPDVELITGKYFKKCKQVEVSDKCTDVEKQKQLWDISTELTQIE